MAAIWDRPRWLRPPAIFLPASLGGTPGTSVQATINGTAVNCFMVYTSAGQVAAILPSTAPVGSGTLTVSYNGQTSAPEPIEVRASGFGTFTLNEAGSGPAVVTDAHGQIITLPNAAQPGQTLILYGTGLGPISSSDSEAPPVGDLGPAPKLFVGMQQAVVTYHGRSPCCAGLDQINFVVPQGASGCYVSVAVQTGDAPGNFSSIAVAESGKVCSDANGLISSQLKLLESGKNVRLGSLHLGRAKTINLPPPSPSPTITNDTGDARFVLYTPRELESSLGTFRAASVGSCLVFVINGSSQSVLDPIVPHGLDAGASISLSGPNGVKQLSEDQQMMGLYTSLLGGSSNSSPYLDPGMYTFSGSGGADVGPLQSQLEVPQAVTWTNADSLTTVNRAQGATVKWTGEASGGFVFVFGYSVAAPTGPQTTSNASTGALFFCGSPAGAGQFTVPSFVLQALPPTGTVPGFPGSLLGGMGLISVSSPVTFSAPGIDVGIAEASSSVAQPTAFK